MVSSGITKKEPSVGFKRAMSPQLHKEMLKEKRLKRRKK